MKLTPENIQFIRTYILDNIALQRMQDERNSELEELRESANGQAKATAKKLEDAEALRGEAEKLKPGLQEALRVFPARKGEVDGVVKELASASRTNDLPTAENALDALKKVVAEGAERARELKASLDSLNRRKASLETLKETAKQRLGGTLPKSIEDNVNTAKTLLDVENEIDPDKIDRAIEASDTPLGDVETETGTLATARAAWLAALGLFQTRFDQLGTHTQAADVAVAAELLAIKDALDKAKEKAAAHTYTEATEALTLLQSKLLEAENLADDCAHYAAILADRETRIGALTNPSGHDAVKERIEAAQKALTDGKKKVTDNTPPDYNGAVALLVPLAKECNDIKWLSNRAERYKKLRASLRDDLDDRQARKDVIQVIARLIDRMEALYEASEYSKTKDILKSTSLLEQAEYIDYELYKADEAYQDYVDAFNAANAQNGVLDNHEGLEAIEADVERLKRDLTFGEDKGDNGHWATAIKVCQKVETDGKELEKIADDYLEYLEAKEELDDEKDDIDTSWADLVAEFTAQIATFENNADTAKTAKDYKAAKVMVERALDYARKANAQIELNKNATNDIDNIKTQVENIQTDLAGVLSTFDSLKQSIETGDADNDFQDDINSAQTRADTAKGAAQQAKPDWATAKSEMTGAVDDLHSVLRKITQMQACKAAHETLTTDLGALKGIARDDALKDEIDAIQKALDDAKQSWENKDFATSQNQIADGRAKLIKAEANGKAYDAYKKMRDDKIEPLRVKLDVPEAQASIKTEADQWEKDRKAAIKEATDTKQYAKPLEKLTELEKTGKSYGGLLDDYKKAKHEDDTWVRAKLVWAKDRPIVADHWKRVVEMRKGLDRMFKARQFKECIGYTDDIYDVLKEADDIYQADESYKVERAKAVTAMDALKKVSGAAVAETIIQADKTLKAADQEAKALVYPNAEKMVKSIPDLCKDATKLGKEARDYAPSLKAAQEAVEKLKTDYGDLDNVGLELQVLAAKIASAEALAKAHDFVGAKAVTDTIPGLVATVVARAKEMKELAELEQAASTAAPDDATGLTQQLAKARLAHTGLTGHPGAGAIGGFLARIESALDEAEKNANDNVPEARKSLTQALGDLVMARTGAENWVRADASVKAAVAEAGRVRTAYPEPLALQQRLDTIDKELGLAREATERGESSSALNYVESVEADLVKLEALGKAQIKYAEERAKLDKATEDLAKHAGRYAIAEDLKTIRTHLATATTTSQALDFPAAMKALDEAGALIETAAITADMTANEQLDENKIKALLAKEGGGKKLDAIIKKLDPQTQRKAVHKALELRFDMKLSQYKTETDFDSDTEDGSDAVAAPNIMRLYDVMDDLPTKHTTGNPSMALVKRVGPDLGTSSFDGSDKVIELRVGRATDANEKLIGMPHELDPLSDKATPKGEGKPQAFNWTTLHEIGHAVDDKLRYMDSHGKDSDKGRWKVYARDVKEIAEAAAAKSAFDYNADYVEAYLSNPDGDLIYPEPEGGASQEEWDRRRIEVETWCDSIRVGKAIWNSASASKKLAINGRVYQQSYKWEWVSYELAARSFGVRGYQFRAPGEWFAEVYAAYHTDKLNDNHPARSWLDNI